MQEVLIQSRVRELTSHMPRSQKKKKSQKPKKQQQKDHLTDTLPQCSGTEAEMYAAAREW